MALPYDVIAFTYPEMDFKIDSRVAIGLDYLRRGDFNYPESLDYVLNPTVHFVNSVVTIMDGSGYFTLSDNSEELFEFARDFFEERGYVTDLITKRRHFDDSFQGKKLFISSPDDYLCKHAKGFLNKLYNLIDDFFTGPYHEKHEPTKDLKFVFSLENHMLDGYPSYRRYYYPAITFVDSLNESELIEGGYEAQQVLPIMPKDFEKMFTKCVFDRFLKHTEHNEFISELHSGFLEKYEADGPVSKGFVGPAHLIRDHVIKYAPFVALRKNMISLDEYDNSENRWPLPEDVRRIYERGSIPKWWELGI